MKYKKLISVMSVLAVCTLSACGVQKKTATESKETASVPTETETPVTTTGETTSKPGTDSSPSTTEQPTTTKTTATKATETTDADIPEETELDIISINDLHGYANAASNSARTDYDLASTDYYIDQVRSQQEYDNVLLIANGDMFQGTAFSNLSYGKSVINAMNQMGFDCMGIGNHEFDWGLEKILAYFDNDESNGEANFPLINGNVDYTSKNQFGKTAYSRVGEDDDTDNILPYQIYDKAGIKVGVLSYIGPETNDINQNKLQDFMLDCSSDTDTLFYQQVKKDAKAIKSLGADIIVANLHYGSTSGVTDNAMNKKLAAMQDADGNYYFDAIINGHTHSYQEGIITREGGLSVPIVQGGSYGNALGRISLKIDTVKKKVKEVISESCEYVDDVNPTNQKDTEVEEVLNYEYSLIKDQISEVYCVNNAYASKDKIGVWTANIMKKYSGADLAFINTGGIRSALAACNVTVEELYEINPFDNNLMYVEATGEEIKAFVSANKGYYYYNDGFSADDLEDSTVYKLITIDYVYYSTYFKSSFKTAVLDYEDKVVCARNLMQLDCKSKKATGLNLSTSKTASLDCAGWKTE